MAKRRKILSVLLIPDGEQQTFTLKIRYGIVKVLFAFLIIFFCFLIAGTISYWKLAKIALDYHEKELENQRLLRDNQLINEIARNYNNTQLLEKRILSNLGEYIDFSEEGVGRSGGQITDNNAAYDNPLLRESIRRTRTLHERSDIVSSYPTLMPLEGPISQKFIRNNDYPGGGHFGIDIVAQELSVISAAGDGIVVFTGQTLTGGKELIIDHQNGHMSKYKHNAVLLVRERQAVRQGDPIALLGNSGESTAPHLHFEIWKDFQPVDPFSILGKKDLEPLNVRN
ncbi:M23 family metallopeptidase [candidate division KSB1 bacterium]